MIVKTYDVFCDAECPQWTSTGVTSSPGYSNDSAREARASARSVGWRRVQVDGRWVDLCPEHAGTVGRRDPT